MAFADEFISGVQAGQALKRARQQEQYEREDREIEKQLLQHRLRELKIGERLQARQAAAQNVELMTGQPEENLPASMLETLASRSLTGEMVQPDELDFLKGRTSGAPRMIRPTITERPATVRGVEIPGVPEFDIPGISVRPQTMQQQLELFKKRQAIEAMSGPVEEVYDPATDRNVLVPRPLSVGLEAGRPISSTTVPFTTRSPQGVETTTYMTPAERAAAGPAIRHPLPPRPAQRGVDSVLVNQAVDALVSGSMAATEIPVSEFGTAIRARASERGFNTRDAEREERAVRAHIGTLNSSQIAQMRIAAATAEAALDNLQEWNKVWQAGAGGGLWDRTRIALAKAGGTPEEREAAQSIEVALNQAAEAFAQLSTGGTPAANKAMENAAKIFEGGSQVEIERVIKSIQPIIRYKANAISNLDPLLSGAAAAPARTTSRTAADVAAALRAQGRASDPVTVEKVMASPEAMKLLFP